MRQKTLDPRLIAITAVMSAVVFVVTFMLRVPTPVVVGYVHLGDAPIFFASFAFGPWVGGIAAALGTALADMNGGYAQWAPFSFVVHGLQGVLVGLIAHTAARSAARPALAEWYRLLIAVSVGSLVVVVGYFIAGMIILMGVSTSAAEIPAAAAAEIPFNIVQVLCGALVGTPLFIAVRRAYPPLMQR